jgi:hypothetical protein
MENHSLIVNTFFYYLPGINLYSYDSRYTRSMDVDRCVDLHNEILTIGWEGRGNDADDLGQSWFEYYGEDATNVRDRLSPDLIAFLKRAWEVGDDHSFFYFVAGLNHPSNMFSEASPDDTRYLTLYAANDIAEHPDGLV